jgi:hypothetical protein
VKSDKHFSFTLDSHTKSTIPILLLYTDEDGKEYLTFGNPNGNEILFYDINSGKLEFKVKPQFEGNNGVGQISGYYIKNLDSIFLTIRGTEEIALINRNAIVEDKFPYEQTIDNLPLTYYSSLTNVYTPLIIINNKMYIMPTCNRWGEKNPVCATIDLSNHAVQALPGFSYPVFPGADNKTKRFGIEFYVSRYYDGKRFVYSFYFDEDIYVASIDHKSVERVKVKSKYINEVNLIDDYGNVTVEDMCENPNYGNMLYDEYREVYYRIAYPKTEIKNGVSMRELMELVEYGRKNFSIIILDKDFNVIGETLFPDYTYNSTAMFIREDGLYISCSHSWNPEYNDDVLSFQRFDPVKK